MTPLVVNPRTNKREMEISSLLNMKKVEKQVNGTVNGIYKEWIERSDGWNNNNHITGCNNARIWNDIRIFISIKSRNTILKGEETREWSGPDICRSNLERLNEETHTGTRIYSMYIVALEKSKYRNSTWSSDIKRGEKSNQRRMEVSLMHFGETHF